MFRNLFNPESALMVTMTQVTDCIFLSLFFVLGCVPVVTMGASFTALYDASFRAFRKGEKNSWQRFFRVFRQNLKGSFLPAAVLLLALICGGWVMIQLWNAAVLKGLSWMVFSAAAFIACALLGMVSLLFPVLSRFENSAAGLLRNTLLLALANLPRTLCLGILNALAGYLCLKFVVPIFFLPSLAALLGSIFVEPMFKPFLRPAEDAAE